MVDDQSTAPRKWYQALGPGLITACVVIGPGSILTSSKVGADNGFALSWVVVASVVFMLSFTTMAARLGVMAKDSPGKMLCYVLFRHLGARSDPKRPQREPKGAQGHPKSRKYIQNCAPRNP